jgi:GT2 family glycosyltransferase
VSAPRVAVLLLSYNAGEHATECLESLLRLRHRPSAIVVCDNASPDGSAGRVRAWAAGEAPAPVPADPGLRALVDPPAPKPLRLVEHDRAAAEAGGGAEDARAEVVLVRTGANAGFAAGNNVGLRYVLARGDADYVWLLNPDTVVDPDALGALVGAAEADPRVGMVGGKLLYYHAPGRVQAAAGGRLARWNGSTRLDGEGDPDDGRWDRPGEPGYVHGACLLVRTALVREVGLLDEAYFMYSEEVDWCLRARRAGWRTAYAPGARVWHKEGMSVGRKSALQDYHSVRSRLILLRKFYPLLLPLGVAHSLYQALLPKLVRRQPERLRAVARAYRDFWSGAAPLTPG